MIGVDNAVEFLLAALHRGPVARTILLAEAARRGLTYSHLRRARERLDVQVDRRGFGAAMASLWALSGTALRDSRPRADDAAAGPVARSTTSLSLSASEAARAARRVVWFTTVIKLSADDAHVAAERTIQRDRDVALALANGNPRSPDGLCAECDHWRIGTCPATPIRPIDRHVCWLRRTDAP